MRLIILLFSFTIVLVCFNTCEKNEKTTKLKYNVLHKYPHNPSSFTQGLLWDNDKLYESTGLEGKSKVMQIDYQTGKIINEIQSAPSIFGEGICILDNIIYQLSWQNHIVFLYDLNTMKEIKTFPLTTEGWGCTTDGKSIIVSDGSNTLYFYHPGDFKLEKTIFVKEKNGKVSRLNELEYVDGSIFANQWESDYIYKINAETGSVVAILNLSELTTEVKDLNTSSNVLNGIAYNKTRNSFFVTGKLWPILFEIELQ